jgi:hypothetical protein
VLTFFIRETSAGYIPQNRKRVFCQKHLQKFVKHWFGKLKEQEIRVFQDIRYGDFG